MQILSVRTPSNCIPITERISAPTYIVFIDFIRLLNNKLVIGKCKYISNLSIYEADVYYV